VQIDADWGAHDTVFMSMWAMGQTGRHRDEDTVRC